LDVKAKGHDGKLFNIEIQISDEADYDKRALYYWAKLYTEQLEQSVDYSTLSKAIGIHILNFKSIFESNKYHNVFRITEKDTGYVYFKDLELHTIELKKFCPSTQEDLSTFMDRVKNSLDMWMTFLTRHDLLRGDKMPKNLDDPRLKKAMDVLNVMNFTEEERMSYEDRLHWLRIEASALKKQMEKGLKKGMKKGEKIGIKKGMEKGREEGEKIGIKKGREEGEKIGMEKATLGVARILKQQGVEPSIIALSTGLSVSVIEKL
jgi:predicted transposase/invertase (TIGR01784 family)